MRRLLLRGASPAIMRPSTSRGVSPGTMPTMRPRYMTTMRSASAATSSSSVETTTTGTPASRVCDDALVDELDRADVEAAGRLGGDEQPQVAAELAGEHDLLLVAAGEPAAPCASMPCVRMSNSLTFSRAKSARCAALEVARADERRAVAAVEHEVLGDRELADEAVFGAVLGHEADARRRGLAPTLAELSSVPSSVMRARARGAGGRASASVSSVWPLPCTPAMARISPRRTVKHTSLTTSCPMRVDDREVPRRRAPASPSFGSLLVHGELDGAADHQRRELGVRSPSGAASPTTLPRRMTVMRSATSRTSRSLWVMKTIDGAGLLAAGA